MDLDDHVCLCFRVSQRKLVNFVKRESPRVPSMLSQCGGAGTGCGWCIPILKRIWEPGTADDIAVAEYAKQRAEYIAAGKGTPPTEVGSKSKDHHRDTEDTEKRGEESTE
jgi:NAD(P)H-nitrite reductase large subunit